MANFTTGVIDLSIENVFDNIIMGATDTMTFINEGTGGEAGKPIRVLGDFTTASGSIITLRAGENQAPGNVSIGSISRDLDTVEPVHGTPATGGRNSWCNAAIGCAGDGADAKSASGGNNKGNNGGIAFGNPHGSCTNPADNYPGGEGGQDYGEDGEAGGKFSHCANTYESGGGSGAPGEPGKSAENVSFMVLGNVDIKGTINGEGGDAGNAGNGGGFPYYSSCDYGGGLGAGGCSSGGGHGGNLYIFHLGTAVETTTKNLTGGDFGGMGTHGSYAPPGNVYTYAAQESPAGGTSGENGSEGVVELISIDAAPEMGESSVADIFAKQAKLNGEVTNNGNNPITERGFVMGKTINPTI